MVENLERPVLHVTGNSGIIELSSYQSLGIKNCVVWVHCYLILGSITNQPLSVCEGHIAGSGSVSLVISNDLHLAMLEYSNTGVGGSKINTNSSLLSHFLYDKIFLYSSMTQFVSF